MIHHKNQPTHKQVLALSKAKGAGRVENILAAAGNQSLPSNSSMTNDIESLESLSECLQESKSTRDITDILAPLGTKQATGEKPISFFLTISSRSWCASNDFCQ